MKVLVWYWGRNGAGAKYTYNLVRELSKLDVDVHLSISNQVSNLQEFSALNLPTFAIDTFESIIGSFFSTLKLPLLINRFFSYLEKNQISVVLNTMHHVWNPFISYKFKKNNISYVATVHDFKQHLGEENLVLDWLAKRDIKQATGLVALTEHVASQIRLAGCEQNVHVIPHGAFAFARPRKRKFESQESLRLFFWGRIYKYKGLENLLDAYGILKERNRNVSLGIYGRGDISFYLSKIKRHQDIVVKNRWIEENEVGDLLDAHDLCVLPYIDGSQSGIIPSALAAGMPVVVTPVAGLSEQLPSESLGCVADVTPEAIAKRIELFLDDPGLLEKESIISIDYAKEQLRWEGVALEFLNVIKEVSQKKIEGLHSH